MIGAADLAWSRRIRGCAALTEPNDRERLSTILRSAATTLESVGHIEAAAAMIDLTIDESRTDPAQHASALTERARLANRSGDAVSAGTSLDRAHDAVASLTDSKLRETLDASIDVAQATLRTRTQPRDAIATLDRSIAFFAKGHLRYLLPDAYLQRARAFRSAGDGAAAIADYDAALREVNAQRSTIAGDDRRLRFLDTAAQIIDESIELHLSRGLVTEAMAIADQTRALHEIPLLSAPHVIEAQTPPRTAVIEYALLPHAIAIFCVSGGKIMARTVVVERSDVADRVTSFSENIRRRAPLDQIRPEATTLFNLLVAPVQSRLWGVDEIVIVLDRHLYKLPFAALYDETSRHYLAERFTIRFTPAASPVQTEKATVLLQPALVIADPKTQRSLLPASLKEGERIAAGYGATILSGDAATRARFVDAATASALIHYAGHADSDASDSYGALLLAATDTDSGVLASRDIARLTLVRKPLVVLAACGTFRGESNHVGGMPSLARAFLLAGARAVAGTLWEVDDDVAAVFFLRFHEHLRAGLSPALALRTTQLEMIHAADPRLQHPATWAPVELLSKT